MAYKLFLLAGLVASASALCPKNEWPVCQDNEQVCPNGFEHGTGCDLGGFCHPKMDDVTGCQIHCPCPPNKKECPAPPANNPPPKGPPAKGPPAKDSAACPPAPNCINMFVRSNNWIVELGLDSDPAHQGSCTNQCPVFCDAEQKLCAGYVDSMGCPQVDMCVAADEECPPHLNDFNGCPIIPPKSLNLQCGEGMKMCSGNEDHLGCVGLPSCWADSDDCPAPQWVSGCPVDQTPPCTDEQIHCYGGYDNKMCDLPKVCVDASPEAKCPAQCPAGCGPSDLTCARPAGPDGCPGQEYCLAPLNSNGCPAHCPPMVDSDTQIQCPGPVDPITKCPGQDIVLDKDPVCGEPQCPHQLECRPDMYGKGAMFCPGPIDSVTGCQAHGSCEQPLAGLDGSQCPVVCPIHCGIEEKWCDGGFDDNGCPMLNSCLAQDELCPNEVILE